MATGKPKKKSTKTTKTTKTAAKENGTEKKAKENPPPETTEETTTETTPKKTTKKPAKKEASKKTTAKKKENGTETTTEESGAEESGAEVASVLDPCNDYFTLPVVAIKKHGKFKNSRHQSSKNVSDLINTITNDGIQTPLTVWEVPCEPTAVSYSPDPVMVQYFLISGFRRLAAVTRINTTSPGAIKRVPVRIFKGDIQEAAKLNFIENIQREDLNAIEVCEYLAYLKDLGHKRGEMAEIIGKSPAWVTVAQQFMKKATSELQQAVKDNILSYTNAMEVSKWEPNEQLRTIEEIKETIKTKGRKEAGKKASKKTGTSRPSSPRRSVKEVEDQLESYKTTPLSGQPEEVKNYYYGIMTALQWVLEKNAPNSGPFWTNIEHVDMKKEHLEPTTPDPGASSSS
jgi:ParB/RepB/Spo0J family partition protein